MYLSDEDVQLIQEHGVPVDPGPEFVVFSTNGEVSFTARGKSLYRLAMLLHGLSPESVEAVRTQDDLRELSLKVKRARVVFANDAAERALNNGKVPPKAREILEAVLYGSPEDLHAATERRLQCEAAGANVIPVAFRRRKPTEK